MTEQYIKDKYKTGDSFTAKNSRKDFSGKIFIGDSKTGCDRNKVFFCSDDECGRGTNAVDKLGYNYSWVFDRSLSDIIITPAKKPEEIINDYQIY